jgi:hypothetical protein
MLRLCSGCISAAKVIADETKNGINNPQDRELSFKLKIDPTCKADKIYVTGVEIATIFRKNRLQNVNLDGVPPDSIVRNFIDYECRK